MESDRPPSVTAGVPSGAADAAPPGGAPAVGAPSADPGAAGWLVSDPLLAAPGGEAGEAMPVAPVLTPDGNGAVPDTEAALVPEPVPPLPAAALPALDGAGTVSEEEPSDRQPREGEADAAPIAEAAVELDQVTKTYPKGMTALDRVSLRIEPVEFVFIVGRTGTGKSTLLKMIYREELPTAGRVLVYGTDVTTLPARQIPFLRRRLGVVFQDFKLLPRKTAWENVAFALEVTGTPGSEIAPRVDETLEVVGLAARADALPGQLSGGEQQRISIARALVHRPSLLLADEPTGNLDPESSWEIMQLLSRINQAGTTVVVATHDKVIVDGLRRRVVAIQSGVIVRDEPCGSYDGP